MEIFSIIKFLDEPGSWLKGCSLVRTIHISTIGSKIKKKNNKQINTKDLIVFLRREKK